MAIYRVRVHEWKRAWLYAILRVQKQYCDWLGVASGEGACPSADCRNKLLFAPTQHPIFTPSPDNR